MTSSDRAPNHALREADEAMLSRQVALLTGSSFFSFTGDDELGIRALVMSDGPVGVKLDSQHGGGPSMLLPNATVLASTWDQALVRRAGALLAGDARRRGVDILLGPTINLARSPLAGRVFECFAEDPLLSGLLAAAYVQGLQGGGVGACLKHFVANDSETDRHSVDVRVDQQSLRELYLMPFDVAQHDGRPLLMMAAYNRLNGVPLSEHREILTEILKREWAFDGLVVSDFFGATSTEPSVNAGLDMVLPGPVGPWGDRLLDAVRNGRVPRARIAEAVGRLRHVIATLDAAQAEGDAQTGTAPDAPELRRELVEIAAAGMVVLTNRGALPMAPGTRVALIGSPATQTLLLGGGSSELTPPHQVSIADGLGSRLGERLLLGPGVELTRQPRPAHVSALRNPVTGDPGLVVDLFSPDGELTLTRHVRDSRTVMGWAGELVQPGMLARIRAEVTIQGAVQVGVIGIGRWKVEVGGTPSEVEVQPVTGVPGEALLATPQTVLDLQPTGPVTVSATVDLANLRAGYVGLIAHPTPLDDDVAIEAAADLARRAEVAVVVVGNSSAQETESQDRTTLALPGAQDRLVERVAEVAPSTVVVVNAAAPVLMPWADRVDAILVAGLPGQEGGDAVAACLLGELEPRGRLTSTWPVADGAAPGWDVVPTDGVLSYTERSFIGHRGHYAGLCPSPAFWFGEGLGYGTWEYGAATVHAGTGEVTVAVTVRNVGIRPSREVIQVYLRPTDTTQPVRLVGWASAMVDAGAARRVVVCCDRRLMRRWLTAHARWADELEGGDLLLARGLGDIRGELRNAIPESASDPATSEPGHGA